MDAFFRHREAEGRGNPVVWKITQEWFCSLRLFDWIAALRSQRQCIVIARPKAVAIQLFGK